ncbi:MAG: ring canal kelch-like protein, partial [Bacteroidota bacterium]
TGSGGDATAQCFTAGATATAVGLVAPADICVDPFSAPRQGGFDVITVDFTEFDPAELFTFGVDIDPNSIQGIPGAGFSGAVSGFELVGATVTVVFNDGSTLVGSLYEEGSLGGSNVLLTTPAPVAPTISVVGVSPTPATVTDPNQTFTVSGTPGDNVSLLLMDSRTFIANGAPPFNVPDVTYYANEAMAKVLYTGTIGATGTVDIPVTLIQTQGAAGTPDGGINRFIAVTHTGVYGPDIQTSQASNPIVLKYEPIQAPEATILVTPNTAINGNAINPDAFQILNTGTVDITSVSIDLSTGFLMDMVFDPVGSAGVGAKCLNDDQVVGTPGFVSPANPCSTPFSQPNNGSNFQDGYNAIMLDFTDFGPGEQFNFSVDVDHTSIKNEPVNNGVAVVSGAELIGATVTVTFADGSVLSACLWEDGSLGGAKAVVSPLAPATNPIIAAQGIASSPATTSSLNQTIDISGPAGAEVVLLQWDTRLYFDVGYDIDAFEANEAMAKVLYTGTLDATGNLSIPVTLLETASTNAGPDGGINHFMAVIEDPVTNLISCISNVITLEVVPASAEVTGTIGVSSLCVGRTIELFVYDAGTSNLVFSDTAPLDGSGGFAVNGITPGTYDLYVKTDGYLQKVSAAVNLSDGSNPVNFGSLLAGDIDGDNDVDLNDFSLFSAAFLSSTGAANYNPAADFDCNGQI